VTEATSAHTDLLAPTSGPAADRFVRRVLRVGDEHRAGAARDAQGAMSTSIFVSAVRCILTYLVIPVAEPTAHVFGTVSRPLSIVLCVLGMTMSVRSMRRFWIADHPKRWAYTAFASVMVVYLGYGLVTDVVHLAS